MTPPPARQKRKKILAVASSGGHWTQLLRLRPAFEGHEVAVIFVTVGTQLPFDRLVKAVDAWAGGNGEAAAFAQIGSSAYKPSHMDWAEFLPADAFRRKLEAASLVVSHAGVGNLLLALQARKPILMMPRLSRLNETRNDHQLATARWLRQMPGVTVVDDAEELVETLRHGEWKHPDPVRAVASPELLAAVKEFIECR